MKYKLVDLIDIKRLQELIDGFYHVVHIPIEVRDLDGNILISSGVRKICCNFHELSSESRKKCFESNEYVKKKILDGEKGIIFNCKNGLKNIAAPIMVNNECLGTIIQGQFIDANIDINYFRDQALKYGYNEKEYVKEVKSIPLFDQNEIEPNINFITHLANMLAEMGYNQLKLLETKDKLQESEERYELVLRGANDGIWDLNLETGKIYYSKKCFDLLGYNELEFNNKNLKWSKLIHPDDYEKFIMHTKDFLNKRIPEYKCEYRIKRKSGDYIWVLNTGYGIWDEKWKPVRIAGSLTDITEKKKKEEIIYNLAFYDALTGLPNRTKFNSDLKKLIDKARSEAKKFGIMIMDIDNFKTINDTMGHGSGDTLLKKISNKISVNLPKNCKLYRIGGDEFVVIIENIDKTAKAEKIAERILEWANGPFDINNKNIFSSISIGISLYPGECEDENKLLENADVALYKSKIKGKNTYNLYNVKMHEEVANRVIMENELKNAVMNNEFVVFYQPQNDALTGRIKGAEALVRWNHPSRGLIGPGEFISISEDLGIIEDIGEFVLRDACFQGKRWNDILDTPIKISVNLSVRQFQKRNLVQRVKEIMEETSFDPKLLELEVTESIAMKDFELTSKLIRKLKKMGISISLDDFGAGYSSLNYLQKLDINTLKIDKSFIDEITCNSLKVSIVRSIIEMAHNLNLKVIAEGVEDKKQLECLKVNGCDDVQGYLFSKPVPVEDFTSMLIENKSK